MTHVFAQNNSVLSTGEWYKFSVSNQGIYKISYNQLKDAGIDVQTINPKHIKIYGNGGKILPQKNSSPRPIDLVENAIYVEGENDNSFDGEDYILFYATSIDSSYLEPVDGELTYVNNFYEESAYYFLTIGFDTGLRVSEESNQGNGFNKITSYDYYNIYEEDKVNLLISGREWYGDKYDITLTHSYSFEIPNIPSNGNIKVTTSLMAQSYETSDFDVSLNGIALGNQEIASITSYQYGLKGRDNIKAFETSKDQLNSSTNTYNVGISYNKNNSDRSIGYTNYILFQAIRSLAYSNNQFNFRSLESLENPFTTFEVSSSNANLSIWDVSNHFVPKNQLFSSSDDKLVFGTSTMDLKEFVIFDKTKVPSPEFVKKVDSQNLRGSSPPEILIVANPEFKSEAVRLATFRSQNDGFEVMVVTPEEIYNEFSSGSQDVTAIRDIAKYYYDLGTLKHILFVGKSSYDFKDFRSFDNNFVPTYSSRNSLHPLKTYSSDDYFGFLEDHEGDWIEESTGDHTIDIGVGRLPVSTNEEARDVVNKIIGYANNEKNLGNWRNNVYFVADDGELTGSLHHKQADQLTVFTDSTYSAFNTNKIFLDSYPQISRPAGVIAPEVNSAIDKAIKEGALIVNYTGHGGMRGWAQESILDLSMISAWTNSTRLPLFVTATCEFGRHDDPSRTSGAERTLLNPNGGSIAIVTTGRPVNSGSNFLLNKAFYKNVFKKINNRYPTLGEVFLATKNESLNGSSNRNFSLLGDPSMTLAYPGREVIIDEIANNEGQLDTLRALSKVTINGHIADTPDFNGTAQITVFDKPSPSQTNGNENPVYYYKEWQNIIFQGYVSVINGSFRSNFIVPKNINYESEEGKVSIYAFDNENNRDANGAYTDVVIGGTASTPTVDNIAPQVSLYINDTTSQNQIIGSNVLLLAKFHDDSGINMSNYGVGGGLVAVLDDSISFDISEYYNSNQDTYSTGWVLFPIDDLETGKHKITVMASDTYGNNTSEDITFFVNASELIITKLFNYPNPVEGETTFGFSHNFSGDHLEIEFTIYKPDGSILWKKLSNEVNIPETIEFANVNFENDLILNKGIYVYGISVRSLSKGVKNRKFQKLIIAN